jgi:hypothetical protein
MKTKSAHDVMAHKSVRDVVALNIRQYNSGFWFFIQKLGKRAQRDSGIQFLSVNYRSFY